MIMKTENKIQTEKYIKRTVDISIKHFSFLVRAMKGMSFVEIFDYLDGIISKKRSANRTFNGRITSGDFRHSKYPVKAAKVLREMVYILSSRIVKTSKFKESEVYLSRWDAERKSIRYRIFRRAMRRTDFKRYITFDITLEAVIIST